MWVWERLRQNAGDEAIELGIDPGGLSREMNRLDSVYDSASDSSSEIAKSKLRGLADALHKSVPDICRAIARWEADRPESDIQPLVEGLESALLQWRSQ